MTPEQRAQAVDLLADGLLVWQVADQIGVDRRAVANVKENWNGRILEMRRARLGQKVDGTPTADYTPRHRPVLRVWFLYCGAYRRISVKQQRADDVMIRVALNTAWTDADIDRLCKALSRMSSQALDALAVKIRGGIA